MAEPDYWTRFFARLRRRQVGERLFQELVRRIQLAQEVLRRWITLRPVRLDADVEKILPLCFGDVRPQVLRRALNESFEAVSDRVARDYRPRDGRTAPATGSDRQQYRQHSGHDSVLDVASECDEPADDEPQHRTPKHLRSASLRGSVRPSARRGVVRPAGFEPTTPGLGNQCSILLSYGRIES